MKSNVPSVCHTTLVHFVTARASLFTDQRMSGPPIRGKHRHFRPSWEQTFWQFSSWSTFLFLEMVIIQRPYFGHVSHRFHFFLFEVMVVKTWCSDPCPAAESFYSPLRNIVPRISSRDPPCHKTKRLFSRATSPTRKLLQLLGQRIVIRTPFRVPQIALSFDLHSRWVQPKYTWSRNDVGSPRSTNLMNFFHIGLRFCFLPAIFSHPCMPIGTDLAFDARISIPSSVLFPIQVPREFFLSVFATILRQAGDRSGFKHGSVIVNIIFAYFTLALSTSQVYMIEEWCWLTQINFFV